MINTNNLQGNKYRRLVKLTTHWLKQPQRHIENCWSCCLIHFIAKLLILNIVDSLLLFMCALKIQILTSHLITQHVFVVVLTNYMDNLTITSASPTQGPHQLVYFYS